MQPLSPNKLELARNIAQAAAAAGVNNILRSSGAGADVNTAFSLQRLLAEIDAVFTQSGIPGTFLRKASFI